MFGQAGGGVEAMFLKRLSGRLGASAALAPIDHIAPASRREPENHMGPSRGYNRKRRGLRVIGDKELTMHVTNAVSSFRNWD